MRSIDSGKLGRGQTSNVRKAVVYRSRNVIKKMKKAEKFSPLLIGDAPRLLSCFDLRLEVFFKFVNILFVDDPCGDVHVFFFVQI